jgi:general secretion pathway protein D
VFKQIKSLGAAGALALTLSVNAWAAQTWTVNFRDSDIQEVIKFVADVTGRTIIIDPRVRGRIKVISNKPVNEEELMQLFRTVLEMHDFSMVDVEGLIRIIPLKDARSAPVPVVAEKTNEKGYLTQVIQLENIAAAKILPSIRPLVPQNSHLSAYDPSNAIIITDSAENIARIRKLIVMLDKTASPITEIIELKYANAADLTQVLDSIEKEDTKRSSRQNTLTMIADKRNNAILITGEDLQRQRIKSLIKRLDRPRPQSGNVRVVYLEYAEAKTVAETLSKVMQNLSKLGPGGGKAEGAVAATVEADEDTNALLITASGDELQSLLDVVARLDVRRAQVLVEAIIVEMSETSARDLGIQWLFRDTPNGTFGASPGSAGVGTVGAAAFDSFANPNDNVKLGALASALTGPNLKLGAMGANNNDQDFAVLIDALESDGRNNILSTPSIVTMDNHEASFTVGQNIPMPSSTSPGGVNPNGGGFVNPFNTIQRQDVGVSLKVTPQINEGHSVLLEVEQEVSSVGEETDNGFITNQKKINTKVLSDSGEIVVLGGFIEETNNNSENRVPLLGRIPLFGRLFRSDSKTTRRTNLMVFLKASVIRDEGYMSEITSEKYEAIRNRQIDQQNVGWGRLKNKNISVLPEVEFKKAPLPADVIKMPGVLKQEDGESDEGQTEPTE